MTIPISSGGGFAINDAKTINSNSFLVVQNGQEWLRTGQLETDTASYPDATINAGSATGLSTGFDTSGEVTNPSGISYDPISDRLYVLDSDYTMEVYETNGTHVASIPALTSGANASVGCFVVYNNQIFLTANGGADMYEYDTAGVYVGQLTYSFTDGIDSQGTLGYDPDLNLFIGQQTSGAGSRVELKYVNQTTGDAGELTDTAVISGYTPYGVTIAFGQIYLSTYSAGEDAFRLYKTPYSGQNEATPEPQIDLSVSATTYDACYGIAATDAGLFMVSRTTDTVVDVDMVVGVGNPNEESINNNGNIFYYVRIK